MHTETKSVHRNNKLHCKSCNHTFPQASDIYLHLGTLKRPPRPIRMSQRDPTKTKLFVSPEPTNHTLITLGYVQQEVHNLLFKIKFHNQIWPSTFAIMLKVTNCIGFKHFDTIRDPLPMQWFM